jgi:hypothetical protein
MTTSVSAFLLVALTVTLLLRPALSRPFGGGGNHRSRGAGGNYYGPYNPCKYEIWPWPSSVECTWREEGDIMARGGTSFDLDPMHFRIAFSPHSKATNSSVLAEAFERYSVSLIFNQPTRVSRGKFVEPQFNFDEGGEDNNDNDDNDDGAGLQKERQQPLLLTTLFVTVAEDHEEGHKSEDADESYEIVLNVNDDVNGDDVNEDGQQQNHAAHLSASSVWGALYGLDTFSQLVEDKGKSKTKGNKSQQRGGGSRERERIFTLRGAPLVIRDAPRYPWRGRVI